MQQRESDICFHRLGMSEPAIDARIELVDQMRHFSCLQKDKTMTMLSYEKAQSLVTKAFEHAVEEKYAPLAVIVLDARGALKAAGAQDGVSLMRWKIAFGKANGALALGIGSRKIGIMAVERPHFINALGPIIDGGLVPVAGGVLIRDADKNILGAIGISGDSSDNDEAAACTAVAYGGFLAEAG